MTGNDEFYIGWEDKAPPGVGTRVRRTVVMLLALSVVRSDFVIRCRESNVDASARARTILGTLYGLTLLVVLGALWVGLGLGHGRY